MHVLNKIVSVLYTLTVYIFPFLFLFLFITGIRGWVITGQKEKMLSGLSLSSLDLEKVNAEMGTLKRNLALLNEKIKGVGAAGFEKQVVARDQQIKITGTNPKALLDLKPEIIRRAKALMRVGTDYSREGYLINYPTHRYYAVVVSYNDLAFALVQRQHLYSLGFTHAKILVLKGLYAVSIEDSPTKSDRALLKAIKNWDAFPGNEKSPFLKMY